MDHAEAVLAADPPEYLSPASRIHPTDGSGVGVSVNMPSDVDRVVVPVAELFQAMYLQVDKKPPLPQSERRN